MFSFLFSLFVISFSSVQGLQITSANYQVQSSILLGRDFTVANFYVDFDDDLYLLEPSFCLTPQDCPQVRAGTEDLCDYSSHDETECGFSASNSTSESVNCQQSDYCDESEYQWLTLTPKRVVTIALTEFELRNFRFYFGPQNCSAFSIKPRVVYGSLRTVINRGLLVESQDLNKWDYSIPPAVSTICPSSPVYGFGTWFGSTWAQNGPAKIQLELKIFDIDPNNFKTISSADQVKCQNTTTPGFCPQFGQPFKNTISLSSPMLIKTSFSSCTQFMIHTEILSPKGLVVLFFKQDKPMTVLQGYALTNVRNAIVMNACPEPNQNSIDIWITVITDSSTLQLIFYLSVDRSEWNTDEISMNQIGTFDGVRYIQGMLQLSCVERDYLCFPAGASFGTCAEYWSTLPRKDGNFLWPVPRILQDSVTSQVLLDEDQFNSTDLLLSNQVRSSLLLESYFNSESLLTMVNWTEKLEQCSLYFLPFSLLATKEGQIPLGRIPLAGKRKIQQCDFHSFKSISTQIETLGSKIDTSTDITDVITTRYSMDVLTFGWDWQGCDNYIISMLSEATGLFRFPRTESCTIDMMKNSTLQNEDPCCNETLSWGTCCEPRDVQTSREFLAISTQDFDFYQHQNLTTKNNPEASLTILGTRSLDETAKPKCKDPDCVTSLLEDYIFYHNLRHSTTPCEGVVTQSLDTLTHTGMEFYRNCKSLFFGAEDSKGVACTSDEDCQEVGSTTCDIFRGRCLFLTLEEQSARKDGFFQCLVQTMPSSLRNELSKEYLSSTTSENDDHEQYERGVSNDQLKQYLQLHFLSDDCNSDFGKSAVGTHYSLQVSVTASVCGPTDWLCYDRSCEIPMFLELSRKYGRLGSTCTRARSRQMSRAGLCSSYFVCNWNSSLQIDPFTDPSQINQITQQCELHNHDDETQNDETNNDGADDRSFCAVCTSPSNCLKIEGVDSESECTRRQFCMSPSGEVNFEIQDQQECEDLWGSCSVPCPSDQSSSTCSKDQCLASGECSDREIINRVKPLFETPLTIDSRSDDDGYCVSLMTPWNKVDCSRNGSASGLNPNSAYSVKDFPFGSFCVRIKNESECLRWESQGLQWIRAAKDSFECTSSMSCSEPDIPTQLKSEKDQQQCSLCSANYLPDFSWTQGEWRGGRMMKGEWKEKSMIEMYKWEESVHFDSLANSFLSVLSKQFAYQLVTQAQCRLNPNRLIMEKISCVCQNGDEQCESLESSQFSVASAELCVNTSATVVAPPSTLTFGSGGVIPSDTDCLTMTVSTVRAESVLSSKESFISLSFRKQNTERNNVWNGHNVPIGDTIGNGIQVDFDTSFETLRAEEICLYFQVDQYDPNHAQVLDFAYRDASSNKLFPLSETVSFGQGLICIHNFTITEEKSSFFPILRDENWERDDDYGTTQQGIYALMVFLYFVPSSLLIRHEIQLGTQNYNNRFFNIAFILALLVRLCYFLGLLIAEPNGEVTVLEFIAVEFPTFCYLSAVSGAAMLWALIRTARRRQLIRRITLFSNIVLYLFFILCTVLFFNLKGDGSYSCFGRLYSEPSTDQQDSLRVIYSSIILIFSLVLAICVLYSTGSLLRQVRSGENKRIQAWMTVTLVISLSVILQCIFAMVYSLAITSSYEYSLILIVLEILPACSILHLVLVIDRLNSSKGTGTPSSHPKESTLPDLNSKATVD